MSDKDLSKLFTVKSPCSEDWNLMRGTDLIRFCDHCRLSVRDISGMNRKQFRRLVTRSGGRLCVRYVQPSPAIPPPPPLLHKIGRRAGIVAASAFTASLSISSSVAGNLPQTSRNTLIPAITKNLSTAPVRLGSATITGTVSDPNGAVIPGVTVSLTRMETNNVVTTTTDDNGLYRFEGLEAGTYKLKFEMSGFAMTELVDVDLRADENKSFPQTLSVAAQSATTGIIAIASPNQPLVHASFADDLDEVIKELAKNSDANVRDEATGYNALECAVRNANREIVQVLLLAKADVNSRDSSGQTPLMMMDEQATSDLVWDLVNRGAKVNLRDNDGETALMAAAAINNTEVLKALVEAGAKVNHTTKDGVTALMLAAEAGYVNNVRALILAGADVNARDKSGKTALQYAQDDDNRATIRLLKQHGAITFEDPEKKE